MAGVAGPVPNKPYAPPQEGPAMSNNAELGFQYNGKRDIPHWLLLRHPDGQAVAKNAGLFEACILANFPESDAAQNITKRRMGENVDGDVSVPGFHKKNFKKSKFQAACQDMEEDGAKGDASFEPDSLAPNATEEDDEEPEQRRDSNERCRKPSKTPTARCRKRSKSRKTFTSERRCRGHEANHRSASPIMEVWPEPNCVTGLE